MTTTCVESGVNRRDLIRPRWRGVIHQWSAATAVVTGTTLVALAPRGLVAMAAAIYAVGVVALFGVSALYHRVDWRPSTRILMKRLDHSMIFVFIAASYTPFVFTVLHGTERWVIFGVVWGGALLGVVIRMLFVHAPRPLTVPLYLALGWVAAFVMPELLHNAGVAPLVLLCVGGALYSLGALAYATRRPTLVPAVFGYHEVFHLAVVLAAICHYIAIMIVILRA